MADETITLNLTDAQLGTLTERLLNAISSSLTDEHTAALEAFGDFTSVTVLTHPYKGSSDDFTFHDFDYAVDKVLGSERVAEAVYDELKEMQTS